MSEIKAFHKYARGKLADEMILAYKGVEAGLPISTSEHFRSAKFWLGRVEQSGKAVSIENDKREIGGW